MAVPGGRHLVERRDRACDLLGGLPGSEREGEQHLAYRVHGRTFAWLLEDHHSNGRLAVNLRPVHGDPQALIAVDPQCRFVPPYLGARGWIGVWLDVEHVDWEALEALAVESWLRVAPERLAAQLGH